MKIALSCSRAHLPVRLIEWIKRGGDEPVLIRRMRDLARAKEADAVIFSGGGDLWRFFRGAVTGRSPELYRDILEYRLFRLCRNKPVLGICRGAQVLTVFSGGSLYALCEPTIHQSFAQFHPLFWRRRVFSVRSDHHQAILSPAPGDRVLARFATVAELAEGENRLLMQFHPEYGDPGVWLALWKEKRIAQDNPSYNPSRWKK